MMLWCSEMPFVCTEQSKQAQVLHRIQVNRTEEAIDPGNAIKKQRDSSQNQMIKTKASKKHRSHNSPGCERLWLIVHVRIRRVSQLRCSQRIGHWH